MLAYADHYPAIDDVAVSIARAVLKTTSHSFAAVWGFFPLAGEETGVAVKVFP